ncbi:hypothetical protein CANINC_002779 [Pichia inconspicua]|uniref:Uncharacterized protein n=1 Tax=Pichia inconspicua TaxID=52247 RepID=A0A4T0X1Z1_9ASCO|nr:hypothetical protein CANINC_002779 [[Candida] inconspicua]
MNLIGGYSSSSDSDNDRKSIESDNKFGELDNISSKKTTAGFYTEEIIDPLQFERSRRRELNFSEDKSRPSKKPKGKKKKSKGDVEDLEGYKGSWGSSSSSEDDNIEGEREAEKDTEVNSTFSKETENKSMEPEEESTFYGPRKLNLLKTPKSYLIKFATTVPGQKSYYVPKKLSFKYKAHKSAVTSLQFFPNTGHTLLSSGVDETIKLWSTTKPGKLLRDYHGHKRPIKHVQFSQDGSQFISCSYDKTVKVWDTESGKVTFKHNVHTNPNMCCFVPGSPNEFMVALDGKKVEHYDTRTGESVQTYEHHESAVTWIEFLNDGKQFITSSDDRSLKIWDIRINMPVKYIQDPKQQAIPIVKKHPIAHRFVGQSMDNQIVTFHSEKEQNYKKDKLKYFTGHKCAAYAIQLGFTPDGKTLFSGDSNGYCFFWDWKTTKIVTKLKVSNDVISCIDVHPLESSLYAMAGYDGNIYLYE